MTNSPRPSDGFTLIELLVVIAIIAILAASLMPALSSATDRSRVTQCRANLTEIGMALRMYVDDFGQYPAKLPALQRAGYITDDDILRCTKTGKLYFYQKPGPDTPVQAVVAACVSPATPVGKRPHGYRSALVELQRGGKIMELEH